MKKNILFIMCDQLRFDYLSCAGHPTLKPPNIDKLAKMGVRFTNAYVQSPVCGASRMSFYTGRYVASHGATWNAVPLKVGEQTMGDYLRPLGLKTALVGKTHMRADEEGMQRLGIAKDSIIGVRVSECGFDPYERDDGLHPVGKDGRYDSKMPRYEKYLQDKGYNSPQPWHDFANSGLDNGKPVSGWFNTNAHLEARVKDEDSETPYMTRRAIDFMEEHANEPWCCHLSLIKPHWPYIAPAPYHNMYKAEDIIPVNRLESERVNAHPVYDAFMNHKVGRMYLSNEAREKVIIAYMGLVKQIDDNMGVLFDYMEKKGLFDNTMIVFTSDHGDYLGDHWLGEKDLFHEESVKVPLIIYDPTSKAKGIVNDDLVETIDLLPTFLDFLGEPPSKRDHILEGISLMPAIHGEDYVKRKYLFSEYHYGLLDAGVELGKAPREARLFMVRDEQYKYTHAQGFPPMLFDLVNDPKESTDLGRNPAYIAVITRFEGVLATWGLRLSQRTTRSESQLKASINKSTNVGILIGYYDENELAQELRPQFKG